MNPLSLNAADAQDPHIRRLHRRADQAAAARPKALAATACRPAFRRRRCSLVRRCAHRHQPGLQWRPHPAAILPKARWTARSGPADGGLPVGCQARRALPEDRQGPGRAAQRRAADEADAGAGRAAAAGQGQAHLRHQDALGDPAGRRRRRPRGGGAAVRGGFADPGRGADAHRRARGRHPLSRQGAGRSLAQGGAAAGAGRPRRWPAGDAQADAAEPGRLLCRADARPARAEGGGAVRRLQPRRRQYATRPQPWRDRQLLACAGRRADGTTIGRGLRRRAERPSRASTKPRSHRR